MPRRRTRRIKSSKRKYTRRLHKMRGGWGTPMVNLPQMFKKGGVMKGGWGGPITSSNPV